MLTKCASSHAATADCLPRLMRDLSRSVYYRWAEKRHDVSVGEHADLPQVRSLHLDAVCCPHLTDRPMRPHAAESCSGTAGITRTCDLEKLDTKFETWA